MLWCSSVQTTPDKQIHRTSRSSGLAFGTEREGGKRGAPPHPAPTINQETDTADRVNSTWQNSVLKCMWRDFSENFNVSTYSACLAPNILWEELVYLSGHCNTCVRNMTSCYKVRPLRKMNTRQNEMARNSTRLHGINSHALRHRHTLTSVHEMT